MTVAVGDGFGAPRSVSRQLSETAARCGGVRLILGWVPKHDPGLDFTAFADVRTFMPGWGLRRATDAGQVSFAPVRMSAVPALLHGPWRPDLLVATVVPAHGGFQFGSEVSWQRAAISAGAFVAAVVSYGAPHADAGSPLPDGQVLVVGTLANRLPYCPRPCQRQRTKQLPAGSRRISRRARGFRSGRARSRRPCLAS